MYFSVWARVQLQFAHWQYCSLFLLMQGHTDGVVLTAVTYFLNRKKHMEQESELQSLRKANQHLENILEATKAHKRQEVSQLHKLHRETLKV